MNKPSLDDRIAIHQTLEETGAPWSSNDDYDLIINLIADRARLKEALEVAEACVSLYGDYDKITLEWGICPDFVSESEVVRPAQEALAKIKQIMEGK